MPSIHSWKACARGGAGPAAPPRISKSATRRKAPAAGNCDSRRVRVQSHRGGTCLSLAVRIHTHPSRLAAVSDHALGHRSGPVTGKVVNLIHIGNADRERAFCFGACCSPPNGTRRITQVTVEPQTPPGHGLRNLLRKRLGGERPDRVDVRERWKGPGCGSVVQRILCFLRY